MSNPPTNDTLRTRLLCRERLVGTFIKTPAYEIIEVLAHSGLDFLILDAEHAPFDRQRTDMCLAMGRALGLPMLVRIADGELSTMQVVLDSGATGIVVPHMTSLDKARQVSRACRFGHGGRGYAGSTRWADYTTRTMHELLQRSGDETVAIVQIEEPEGVDIAADLASIEGIDALFVGPADLAVSIGVKDMQAPEVKAAMQRVGEACVTHGKSCVTFSGQARDAHAFSSLGVNVSVIASEHSWILAGARQCVADAREHGDRTEP